MEKGLVQIYTGDGKGKTTAAVGQALRALGRGLRVIMIQFLKSDQSGEVMFIKKNIPEFKIYRFNSQKKSVWKMNSEEHEKLKIETSEGFDLAKKIIENNDSDVLILDEAIPAINKEYITFNDIYNMIQEKPDSLEIIMTGRGAGRDIIEIADLVTEMKKIKHPYDMGIRARTGIER